MVREISKKYICRKKNKMKHYDIKKITSNLIKTISWCYELVSIEDPENSLRIIEERLNLREACSSIAFHLSLIHI